MPREIVRIQFKERIGLGHDADQQFENADPKRGVTIELTQQPDGVEITRTSQSGLVDFVPMANLAKITWRHVAASKATK